MATRNVSRRPKRDCSGKGAMPPGFGALLSGLLVGNFVNDMLSDPRTDDEKATQAASKLGEVATIMGCNLDVVESFGDGQGLVIVFTAKR